MVTGAPVPKEKMDSAMEDLNVSLKTFEEKFLQNRPFIIGEKISLADLVAIVEIMQVKTRPVYLISQTKFEAIDHTKMKILSILYLPSSCFKPANISWFC